MKKQVNIHIRLLRTVYRYAGKSLSGRLAAALLAILVPYLTIFLSSGMISSLEIRDFRLAIIFLGILSLTNLANGGIRSAVMSVLSLWNQRRFRKTASAQRTD